MAGALATGRVPDTVAMADKMPAPEAQADYRRRKAIGEAPNAWIKHPMGFSLFSMHGLTKVRRTETGGRCALQADALAWQCFQNARRATLLLFAVDHPDRRKPCSLDFDDFERFLQQFHIRRFEEICG